MRRLISVFALFLVCAGICAEEYRWTKIHSCDEMVSGLKVMLAMEDYAENIYVLHGTGGNPGYYTWKKLDIGQSISDLPQESYHSTIYLHDSLWQFVTKMAPYLGGQYSNQTYEVMAPIIRNHDEWTSGGTKYWGLWGAWSVNEGLAKAWHIEPMDIYGHFYFRSTTNSSIATPVNYFLSYDPNRQYMVSRNSYTAINQWEEHLTLAEATHDKQRAAAITIYAYLPQYNATFELGEHSTWDGSDRNQKILSGASMEFPIPIADKGWVFTGWNTKQDGSGIMLTEIANFMSLHSDTTLYAQYRPNFSEQIIVHEWNYESIVIQTGQAVEFATTQVIANATPATVQYGEPLSLQEHILPDCMLQGDISVYCLPFNAAEVAAHTGKVLNIVFYDGNENEVGIASLTIPIIVTQAKNLSAYPSHLTDACDIYVDNKGVLTINDDRALNHIRILGGGKITIPAPRTLNAQSLIMHGGDIRNGRYYFRYPQLVANGRMNLTSGVIYYDYLLSSKQYYSLCLPYNVAFSDITYRNGTTAVRRSPGASEFDYDIQYYDGELRTSGASGWKPVPTNETAIHAGQGYIICAYPPFFTMNGGAKVVTQYGYLRFPLHVDFSEHGEEQKLVPVLTPGFEGLTLNPQVKVNDAGWNLVGNPYLATFNNETGLTTNGISLLVEDEFGEYSWVGDNRYVVIPANDGHSYSQILAKNATLPAFKNFFVQIGNGDALDFTLSNRAQRAPAWEQSNEEKEYAIGLVLSHEQREDMMGVVCSEHFTEEYEINADLAKWMNQDLNIYALANNNPLAYIALPQDKTTDIPLGFTASTTGSFTMQLDSLYDYSSFEAVNLYDSQTKEYVNLLEQDYTFSSSTKTCDTRFSLTLVLKQQQAPTAINPTIGNTPSCVYDVMGRLIQPTGHGIYILQSPTGVNKIAW